MNRTKTLATRQAQFVARGAIGKLFMAFHNRSLPPSVLIDGPAGTGKTYGILMTLHLVSLACPRVQVLIARKTRRSLTDSVLKLYEQFILPATGHEFIASGPARMNRAAYQYPNGSEWSILSLDDSDRVRSSYYDVAFINEATECEEHDVDNVDARVGRPGCNARLNCTILDCNPSIASHWIMKRVNEGRLIRWPSRHQDNPAMHDGHDWTDAGKRYLRKLMAFRGSFRARMLEGKWVAGEGAYFDAFDERRHVSTAAEYDSRLPVILAADSGIHTGAVWFQIRHGEEPVVTVFGDHYVEKMAAYHAAKSIIAKSIQLCNHRVDAVLTDPAGSRAEAVADTTVLNEWARAGLESIPWPRKLITTGLYLLESLIAADPPRLLIHPRCEHLIAALGNYRRARSKDGQWLDRPADPQHPYEDLIDPLRCGVYAQLDQGRVELSVSPTADWRG